MRRLPRRLVPATLACALVLALAFAATAAAETKIGEANSIENSGLAGEADIIAASVSYDTVAGTVTVNATTREAPGNNKELVLFGGLLSTKNSASCIAMNPETGGSEEDAYPTFSLTAPYSPEGGTEAAWLYAGRKEEGLNSENAGTGTRSVSGARTTIVATTDKAVEQAFNCALVGVIEGNQPADYLLFPLLSQSTLRPSNATPSQPSQTTSAPAPAFAPAALSIAGSKPLKAKTGKWTKVRIKVSNTGGTAVGPIALKAKAPAGVIVRPGSPKLPALLGGQTWTVLLHVKLTERAKARSTIFLTGSAAGLSAKGSVVVKSRG